MRVDDLRHRRITTHVVKWPYFQINVFKNDDLCHRFLISRVYASPELRKNSNQRTQGEDRGGLGNERIVC